MGCQPSVGMFGGFITREEHLARIARITAAKELARQSSLLLGISEDDALTLIYQMPVNTLSLLESPEGWTALAGCMAGTIGRDAPDLIPAVH